MRNFKNRLLWFIRAHTINTAFPGLLLLTLCAAPPLHATDLVQTESLRQSVLALDSARQTALGEISSNALARTERDDYKDFIVYLNTRIVNYCMELADQGGALAVQGLPCPEAPITGNSSNEQTAAEESYIYLPVAEPQETHTRAEKTASMDKQLFSALSEFDELLLKEEEKVASRVPSQRESGSNDGNGSSGSGGGSSETGESGGGMADRDGAKAISTAAGESGSSSGQSRQTARSGTTSGAQGKVGAGAGDASIDRSANGAPGGKLPPLQDDDIVARQLREAAEKETDPELKKKLWEEYWKYKGVKKGE